MSPCACERDAAALERATLRTLIAINGAMFVAEAVAGWWAQSSGLLADSLDMLADAAVYGIALYAVGRARALQVRAAATSGVLQVLLGLGVLFDVARRLVVGSEPVSLAMMLVGLVALAANVTCLVLVSRHRAGGVHMRASYIFSANDVIANTGVILSGGLVLLTGRRWPDLVVGTAIAALVVHGGVRILHDSAAERAATAGRM